MVIILEATVAHAVSCQPCVFICEPPLPAVTFIVREPKPDFWMNLVSSDKVFFSAVSCSLEVPLQKAGGCPVISLEHCWILTPSWPKHHNPRKIRIYEISCKILKSNAPNLLSPMCIQ